MQHPSSAQHSLGGRAWCNFVALLHGVSSVLVCAVCVTDVYGDKLADVVIDPSVFKALETSGEPMDVKLGTGVWLLAMKLFQLAIDDRNQDLTIDCRVMLRWLALFVADSFVVHPVVKRNIVACILEGRHLGQPANLKMGGFARTV